MSTRRCVEGVVRDVGRGALSVAPAGTISSGLSMVASSAAAAKRSSLELKCATSLLRVRRPRPAKASVCVSVWDTTHGVEHGLACSRTVFTSTDFAPSNGHTPTEQAHKLNGSSTSANVQQRSAKLTLTCAPPPAPSFAGPSAAHTDCRRWAPRRPPQSPHASTSRPALRRRATGRRR